MLSVNDPILAGDIYWVKVWKEDKVFQLNGYAGDRVIVKQESDKFTPADIRASSFFMSQVDPGARAVPLSPADLSQLSRWCDENVPYADLIPGALDLQSSMNNAPKGAPWIKMKAFRLVESDKAALLRGTGDKTDVRLIASLLNASGGLEKLGMIMAADFFIGNTDRFTYVGDGTRWPPYPARCEEMLKVTANAGNVFAAIDPDQNKGMISGLDYLDPNGLFRLSETDVAAAETRSDKVWLGRLLRSDNKVERMKYVHLVGQDLNTILGPRNRKLPFSCKDRVPMPSSAIRLNFGIETGVQKLRQSLRGITKFPDSLKSRMSILGWT
jgi:hypothetical protein